jgi:hypothetical protein
MKTVTDIRKASKEDLDNMNKRARKGAASVNGGELETTVPLEVVTEPTSLQELDAAILKGFAELNSIGKSALEKGIKWGGLLTERRKTLKHGQWLPWLKTMPFSDQTARRYMSAYEIRSKFNSMSNLTEAYRLTIPKSRTNKEKPTSHEIDTAVHSSKKGGLVPVTIDAPLSWHSVKTSLSEKPPHSQIVCTKCWVCFGAGTPLSAEMDKKFSFECNCDYPPVEVRLK